MSERNMPVWPGWETVRLIGRGSFGAVYEIRRDVFGDTERAALKHIVIPQNDSEIEELRSEGLNDASITDTFREQVRDIVNEYKLLKKLGDCPNVVSCDDVEYIQHDDGYGWDILIKMELLTPLTKSLGSGVITAEDEVVRLGTDICRALEYCGRYSIIHRDIKPQNIFVSDGGQYKLGDFGIARITDKTGTPTARTGTYTYMAPEVYRGQRYGAQADIYSLGMVLYWLLNERRAPFVTTNTAREKEEARQRRFSGEPLPAPAHGNESLKQVVLKACAYDPKDRYQSAEEMLAALENASKEPAAPKPPKKRLLPLAAAVIGVLALALFLRGKSTPPAEDALPAKPAAETETLPTEPAPEAPEPTETELASEAEEPPVTEPAPEAAEAPAEDPTPRPLPGEGWSEAGTQLIDIVYDGNGKILSLTEIDRDKNMTEWIYVYSQGGSFLYRKHVIGEAKASVTSKHMPGTSTGYFILKNPLKNCVGFTVQYGISEVKGGNGLGDRKIMIQTRASDGNEKWTKVGEFAYPTRSAKVKTTVTLDKPVTIYAYGFARIKPSGNTRFAITQKMTNIWLADYSYLEPVS